MGPIHSQEQFLKLIEQNKGIIYKVSRAYGKNDEDREDLFQEIMIRLWNAFDRYDDQYKLSTWMYRVALNVAISFYRKQRRRIESESPLTESMIDIADESDNPDLENNVRLLQQFISELNELEKALMILYLESKSYKEIAEILGITETNVATKINRVKGRLREKFLTIKS
ncbi:MAG TPA: sigma-70 family RNA polymerase sigma factor [Mucilaginibacter sp.]|jgi:RNA polymerase sigma factor (sigma-70 family)|nr:sigma-70 family RNA polymerase sigma factor [Mucilaginibacter sp.]